MRRRSFGRTQKHDVLDENLINLTPLIDVVFVVLIAFILIAPLIEVDKVNLARASQSCQSENLNKSGIQIYVKEDDSIWLNHRMVTQEELILLLKEKKKTISHEVPQLYHDKKACFGTYQIVKNCVETAGFLAMDVVLYAGK